MKQGIQKMGALLCPDCRKIVYYGIPKNSTSFFYCDSCEQSVKAT